MIYQQLFLLAWEKRKMSKIWKVAWDFFFFACERDVVLECVSLTLIAWDLTGLRKTFEKIFYLLGSISRKDNSLSKLREVTLKLS